MPSLPTPGGSSGTWGTLLNQWLGQGGQVYDVVAGYGADPTGVADSTTAIQAALNAVPTGGGQVLFRGKFLISAPLVPKDGTALVGVGCPIPFTATTPAVLTGPSMTQPLIQRTDASQNVTIEGLQLAGNSASATCKGIYAAEPYRWTIRDCHIRNCGGQAIHFAGGGGAGYASILENIVASGLLVRTGWAWGTGVVDLASTDMRLDFVEATASTNSDSWTGTAGNIVAITIRGSTCFITNCVAENAEYGWTFTDSLTGQNLVMNCRSDLNNGRGWEIAQPHNTFVQCVGYNNSRAANGAHNGFVIDNNYETLVGCRNFYDSTPAIGYGFVDFVNTNTGDYRDYNSYLGCRNSQPPVNGEYLFGGTGTKLWLGGSNTGMVATSKSAQSTTAPDPGASGTIATAGIGVARVSPAAARAGVILAAGTQPGQEVWVVNEAVAANTITFAVAGTSNVADGVSGVIAGLTAKKFVWDSVTARWYRAA